VDLPFEELQTIMKKKYLLQLDNSSHVYLFPGSVKNLHPEFDQVIDVILKTDPTSLVFLI
jgi:hypothetical protein